MPFVSAMKNFFGLLPGQSVGQFATELKPMTFDDKMEFAKMLRAAGVACDDPIKAGPVTKAE